MGRAEWQFAEFGSRHFAYLLAILLEALSSFLGRVDVVGPRLHANALDLGLRDVGLVLRKILRAERVLVAARCLLLRLSGSGRYTKYCGEPEPSIVAIIKRS